jgi:hypothetical protein
MSRSTNGNEGREMTAKKHQVLWSFQKGFVVLSCKCGENLGKFRGETKMKDAHEATLKHHAEVY